jgi:hypothetical protein
MMQCECGGKCRCIIEEIYADDGLVGPIPVYVCVECGRRQIA